MPKQLINKTHLDHLAELVRIKLSPKESEKFLKDLKKILDYFEELKKVNTIDIELMSGGTELKNIFRQDTVDLDKKTTSVDEIGRIMESFPETDRGYLKVPKIL
ncbi:MAG: Asp-tRNA(Asn)/Glu-tRNA(Gln) amidotransferase subunit GatC [Patescibacteria group bacterium]